MARHQFMIGKTILRWMQFKKTYFLFFFYGLGSLLSFLKTKTAKNSSKNLQPEPICGRSLLRSVQAK